MRSEKRRQLLSFLWITLSYWLLWAVILFTSAKGNWTVAGEYIFREGWRIAYLALVNTLIYVFIFPVIPKKKGKWMAIAAVIILMLLLYTAGMYGWLQLGKILFWKGKSNDQEISEMAISLFAPGLLSFIYFGSIKYYLDALRLKEKNEQLLVEKHISELNFLKSQTNPHFLFNTLNNIYSLARDKSDLTAECVLRLSKILRFMLYETGENRIDLHQEIKIIEDYIELEKMRYDDSLSIDFRYATDDSLPLMPPLLLIPLVENAFKHGVSETREAPFIRLALSLAGHRLTFTVENSTGNDNEPAEIRESIGLGNIRKQLELQFSQYDFTTERKDGIFMVKLNINLNSYEENKMPGSGR